MIPNSSPSAVRTDDVDAYRQPVGFSEGADRLDAVQAAFEGADSAVAGEYAARVGSHGTAAARVEASDVSIDDVAAAHRRLAAQLTSGAYDAETIGSRVAFGRRAAEASLPLSPLLGAYDAYLDVVVARIERQVERSVREAITAHVDDEAVAATAADEATTAVADGVERIRCAERLVTADQAAVADGYLGAPDEAGDRGEATDDEASQTADVLADGAGAVGADAIPREELEAAVDEIESRHLRPIQATTQVVKNGSGDACEYVEAQTERTVSISEDLASVSATVEEIASKAGEVERVSSTAEQQATEGRDSAREAVDMMEDVEAAAQDVSDDIASLDDHVAEIDEVVTVINDIADQTNLLALNANIEAARVGSSDGDATGDGFAVVAEEVKSLAEESQEQASEIEAMIAEIQSVTDDVVTNLDVTTDQLSTGVAQVESAMEQLDDIAEAVTEASQGVQEIAEATEDQAEMTESVTAEVDEVAERAETVNDEIDRIAAANGEQADKIDGLIDAVDDLRDL